MVDGAAQSSRSSIRGLGIGSEAASASTLATAVDAPPIGERLLAADRRLQARGIWLARQWRIGLALWNGVARASYALRVGYVSDLRRLIGHRPILLPGANVLVVDDAGRVLLQRRVDTGEWGIVGGGMELDETIEQTARRELREELGLEAGALELVDLVSGPRFRRTYPNGDQIHGLGVIYVTREVRGELRLDPEEVRAVAYFRLDDLPVEMHPSSRFVLERYREWVDRMDRRVQ